jgi:hypothetical protein
MENKTIVPLNLRGYYISFDAYSLMLCKETDNRIYFEGHFPTLLGLFLSLLHDSKQKSRWKFPKKDIPLLEEIVDLLKNRRKAEINELPKIYGIKEHPDSINSHKIYLNVGQKREINFPCDKTLDRFIFESVVKLQRFKGLEELRDWLEMEWL